MLPSGNIKKVDVTWVTCAGVQIIGGVLAVLSGLVLVVFFAKLDELVSRQYYNLFQVGETLRVIVMFSWY